MKNLLYILVLFLFLQNCGINKKDQYISNITKEYRDFGLLLIIPVVRDDTVVDACISNTILYRNIFVLNFKSDYNNYFDFVYSIMYQDKKLEFDFMKGLPHKIINPKAEIFNLYKEKGFKGLIGIYLEERDERFYSIHLTNEDDINGLIKIMFENHYYISWDDYSARYVFSKELIKNE